MNGAKGLGKSLAGSSQNTDGSTAKVEVAALDINGDGLLLFRRQIIITAAQGAAFKVRSTGTIGNAAVSRLVERGVRRHGQEGLQLILPELEHAFVESIVIAATERATLQVSVHGLGSKVEAVLVGCSTDSRRLERRYDAGRGGNMLQSQAIGLLVDVVEADLQGLGAKCESRGRHAVKMNVDARDLDVNVVDGLLLSEERRRAK